MSNIAEMPPRIEARIRPDFSALAELRQVFTGWCVWEYRERPGKPKPAKVPCDGKGGQLKTSEPSNWLTFDAARAAFERGGFDGVGVLLTGNAVAVVGGDIDNCLDSDGNIVAKHDVVAAMMKAFPYVEISPSGCGLRGFGLGAKPEGARHKNDLAECYDSATRGRYFTVTGVKYVAHG